VFPAIFVAGAAQQHVMFTNTLSVRDWLFLALAMPVLALGWVFLIFGSYHLGVAIISPSQDGEASLSAIWEFAFGFGATSIAVLLASRTAFLDKQTLRRAFLYSQIVASILFLGYLSYGVLLMLAHTLH
jgi:hypothetical protein